MDKVAIPTTEQFMLLMILGAMAQAGQMPDPAQYTATAKGG
jgi:hypothetical protein